MRKYGAGNVFVIKQGDCIVSLLLKSEACA